LQRFGLTCWDQGENFSLLQFQAIQYERRGKVMATAEQSRLIAKLPKREFMRREGQPAHVGEGLQKRSCAGVQAA
jgi:hypothetical protein